MPNVTEYEIIYKSATVINNQATAFSTKVALVYKLYALPGYTLTLFKRFLFSFFFCQLSIIFIVKRGHYIHTNL